MPDTHFFLGTNGPDGFYSIYDELTRNDDIMLYVLKGGPGCGKSSFMKRIGAAASKRGCRAEYIRCSGDPDSLDAVILPDVRAAFVDGTAPHVGEPRYPGVSGLYLDLSCFYDTAALAQRALEIRKLSAEYKSYYAKAYAMLRAAHFSRQGAGDMLVTDTLAAAIRKRAAGIALREFGRARGAGTLTRRFLSAHTCMGEVFCADTVGALCGRVYLLDNELGFSDIMLRPLMDAALAAGYDVTACPCPMRPEKLEHLLVPELSLGFISGEKTLGGGIARRHIRLDAMAGEREDRKERHAAIKRSASLMQCAYESLARAKSAHDELEAVYNPHVDFGGVYALADGYIERLFG